MKAEFIPMTLMMVIALLMFGYTGGRIRGESLAKIPGDGQIIATCKDSVITSEPLDNETDQMLYCIYKLSYDKSSKSSPSAKWDAVSCQTSGGGVTPSCEVVP